MRAPLTSEAAGSAVIARARTSLEAIEQDINAVHLPCDTEGRPTGCRLVGSVQVDTVQVDTIRIEAHQDVDALHFRAAGPAIAPACVFVPGRFGTSAVFTVDQQRDVRLFLAAHGIDVYSVEHRRRPASQADPGTGWGTATYLADLARCVSAVDAPVVLIGHSMGAFLSYLAAARWPDRTAGVVALDGGVVAPDRGDYDRIDEVTRELADDPGGWEPVSGSPATLRRLVRDARAGLPCAQRALSRALSLPAHGRTGSMIAPTSDAATIRTAASYLEVLPGEWPRRQSREARLIALYGPGGWADGAVARLADRGVRVFAVLAEDGDATRSSRVRHTALLADPRAQVHGFTDYGHLDVLFGPDVHTRLFWPLLTWLRTLGQAP